MNTQTPFFYFDSNKLTECAKQYSLRNFKLYYSVKACLFKGLIHFFSPLVDGFTVSSIRELENTRSETKKNIHFVSPLIRKNEIDKINSFANSITFNSLEQFERFKNFLDPNIKFFFRINPEISFIGDKRYNPCRPYSKLGIPLTDFKQHLLKSTNNCTAGIHFHNACQEHNISNIIKTLNKIKTVLGCHFYKIPSINLGGGYLFSRNNFNKLQKISDEHNNKLIIEPGFDLVNSAGYLTASVTDLFKRKHKTIAVLDTSVNHLPEVFEYDITPEVINTKKEKSKHSYILAGASCLAGDVFGEHHFKNAVNIGSVIAFKNIGAYSLVKAHTFNGLEIPKIWMGKYNIQRVLRLLKENNSTASDFHSSAMEGAV